MMSPALTSASNEQIWQYTVNTLPGQVFKTLPEAEAGMRGVSIEASLLKLSSEAISSTTAIRNYNVPSIPQLQGEWAYPDPWHYDICFGSEGALIASAIETNSVGSPCPYDFVANGNWSSSCTNCALVSKCGISTYATESQTKPYQNHYYRDNACTVSGTGNFTFSRVRENYCPAGYHLYRSACVDFATATITGTLTQYCGPTKGNPCNVATGEKVQTKQDSSGTLPLNRTYHSINQFDTRSRMGFGWFHNYSAHLMITNGQPTGAVRASGYAEPLYKRPNTNNYVAYTGSGIQVEPNGTNWSLYLTDGATENYDATGRLISLADKAGSLTALSYDPSSGVLSQVSNMFGNTLVFGYDPSTLYLLSVTDSAGQAIQYGYTGNNLTRVTYPDGAARTYVYENASFPNHLTGIIDENGARYATYTYDSLGRAVSTEHAGGSEKVTLQFNVDGTTMVTDAVGQQEVFAFSVNGLGLRDVTGVSKSGSQTSKSYTIESGNPQHRVSQSIDELGRKTTFTYDIRMEHLLKHY